MSRSGPSSATHPHNLQGYIDGIIAFLRTDPSTASVAFPVIAGEHYRTIVFADGRGFLDYRVFEDRQVVVVVNLAWLEQGRAFRSGLKARRRSAGQSWSSRGHSTGRNAAGQERTGWTGAPT